MTTSTVISGLAFGALFGFILQRGRFCLNTAFRDILYIKDTTVFRSYLVAVLVAAVGGNLLEQFGLVRLDASRQTYAWLANIVGGFLFGSGMVLAGGSASGTWYRVGEGLVGSWFAVMGFMAGLAAAGQGVIQPVTSALQSVAAAPGQALTLDGVLGVNRWVILALVVAAGLVFLLRGGRRYLATEGELRWHTTGALVGLLITGGWYLSLRMTGSAWGVTFTGPSEGMLLSLVAGRPLDWGAVVVAGVPIGAALGARMGRQFSWRAPRAAVLVQQLGGGFIMGAGGAIAGGCLIGHGITGIAALSLSSATATVAAVLGCWTMVYVLFMKSSSSA